MLFASDISIFWSIQFILISGFLLWVFNYIRRAHRLWSDLGIPGPKAKFLFGTDWELAVKNWPELSLERYKKYGKLHGGFQLLRPVLYIHDPEFIKEVFIKQFHCFANRINPRPYHEFFNQNMLFADDEKWKRMRTISSPSFTTGKLRNMSPIMNKCFDKLFNYFEKAIKEKDGVIATKQVVAGLTMDVIAAAGFSTDAKTNDERSTDTPFLHHGLNLFKIKAWRAFATFTLPRPILTLIGIRTLNCPESLDYFVGITKEIIRQRRKLDNSSNRPNDLLQLMLEAEVDEKEITSDNYDKLTASMNETEETEVKKQNNSSAIKRKLTETEVIANCIFFLIAGFETTSSTISHAMFELAWNPKIQERLYDDLKQSLDGMDPNSKEYYDVAMNRIPYFEAFIKETLRMYPPVSILTRRVSCDKVNLKGIPLIRDTQINIPAHAIHHCEEYYENPDQFNPERFMPENKDKLIPYTFMPFGLGPRNCIGMRFAYQEIKLGLARLLMKYRVETTSDTPRKLAYGPRSPLLLTSPFNLRISKR